MSISAAQHLSSAQVARTSLSTLTYRPRADSFQSVLKRYVDAFGAFALIMFVCPLLALLSLLVYFTEGMPIIHRTPVVGQAGEFDAFKFRTMCRGADAILASDLTLLAEYQRNFKLQRDPRVTTLGAFLRRFSLDELPQLFNVLRGQMSLVGPRTITASELTKYGNHQNLLLRVRPGLTGYWQVFGRQNVSYDERVRLDIQYLENSSLSFDLAILIRTPLKVLKMEGAV